MRRPRYTRRPRGRFANDTAIVNASEQKGLLPNGLRDALAPDAAYEAEMTARMIGVFAAHGYDCVRPPLVEFEESLLDGPGGAVAGRMFRLMDPVSHRMMGLRPDITPQVARIATTRLRSAARPLRLSYAGPVLTVSASELRPDREVIQVGAELIGAAALSADAEVITVAAEALQAIGVDRPSFDLSMPQLVPMVCAGLELDAATTQRARQALDRKDAGAVAALGVDPNAAELLATLLRAAGEADQTLAALAALSLPPAATELVADLGTVLGHIRAVMPDLRLTVDPVEFRGAEYQTGISFTIFADGARAELGRGGRYPLNGETATGVTLFVNALRGAVPPPPKPETLYLPAGTKAAKGARLRAAGWRTVRGLEDTATPEQDARALGCTHVLANGEAQPL